MDNLNQNHTDKDKLILNENLELIKLLLSEREYHSSHPSEASSKFWYSLGTTLTLLVTGLILSDKVDALLLLIDSNIFYFALSMILLGHVCLIIALLEHNKAHKLQCERIEEAIHYLFKNKVKDNFRHFWIQYGKAHFSINEPSDKKVLLFAKEPDTREGFKYHDTKIILGAILISFGIVLMIGCIFLKVDALN